LEDVSGLNEDGCHLLRVFTYQCASALSNLRLHLNIKEAKHQSLYMLAVVAECKDHHTGAHISRMAETIRRLALELGLDTATADDYGEAGMLHDIGKLAVPDRILQKPGRLDEEEFAVMRSHPEVGARILSYHQGFALAAQIALSHHERWDGTGYPHGLKGEEIPQAARITALADVFDALVNERPYKKAWPLEEVVTEIRALAGSHFDPRVVEALSRLLEQGQLPLSAEFNTQTLIPSELYFA
jgi:putative two-component system response regulator